MRAEISENIKAYEEEISIRRQLGEVIEESDVNTQKAEMTKQGILNIVIALKLTEEQVKELKAEFGDLFESAKVDSQTTAEWFKENWQRVFNEVANFTNEMLGGVNDIFQAQIQQQIDALEVRKNKAIDAVNDELKAYLKANKLTEKTEKDKLKDDIKSLKARQKLALGLYEQERIKKAIEEKQKSVDRITAEETADKKIQELNVYYTNQKLKLEHKAALANWKTQLAQATASGAQAIVNAVMAGMATNLGAPIMVPLLTTMAATLTGVQIAAISAAKPPEPELIALAKGGLIRRRAGGLNAIIGEGNSNEAVIPLKDDVLAGIGEAMAMATQNRQVITTDSSQVSENIQNDFYVSQPMLIQIDGRTLYASILQASKRGIKVVHTRGIIY